jgi:hypothetical protein
MRALHRDTKRRRENSLAAKREREMLDMFQRIDRAKQAARENHVDIDKELRLLYRTRNEHARNERSEVAVMRRLEDVERRAYRDAA